MIYAKFIRDMQVVESEEEFDKRNGNEEYAVYCVGKTTVVKLGRLCSVPLNYIFCDLKYGNKIAIIDSSDSKKYLQGSDYPSNSSQGSYIVETTEQKVKAILDLTPSTIEYIFNEVKKPELFPVNAYITNLEFVPYDVCEKYFELMGQKVPDYVNK